MDYEKSSELLRILGHPLRLKMVEGLMRDECNVNRIVEVLNLPQSTVSQHLSLLKSHGIVVARKEGVRTCYRVIDERVKKVIKIFNASV